MVSEEVKMLQRDHPSPSFGEPDPNTLRPPGAGQTVDLEAQGEDVRPGRMGENDGASREGPSAQGAGRVVEAVEDVQDTTMMARGVRSPRDAMVDPSEGGQSVMDAPAKAQPGENITRPPDEDEEDGGEEEEDEYVDDDNKTWTQLSTRRTQPASIQPGSPSRQELLHSRYSPSTIAGGSFEDVIEDRMKIIAEPAQQDYRDPQHLAQKMMSGQFVRFTSKEEKDAVEEAAKKIAARRAQELSRKKGLSSGDVQPSPSNYEFRPLPDAARNSMVAKMVSGKSDPNGLMSGKPKADTSDAFRIFVGNQDNKELLREAFSAFGSVSEVHVKGGYSFVAFRERADAEKALKAMDGSFVGDRTIRCNWAKGRKPSLAQQQAQNQPVLNEIAKMTLKNGTYLGRDRHRFLSKVQSLLPATPAGKTQHIGGTQQAKA